MWKKHMNWNIINPHLRVSFVSVLLVFNASLNDVAPTSPMLFPIVCSFKQNFLISCFVCFYSWCSQNRLNLVNVVLIFKASPNELPPILSIMQPVRPCIYTKNGCWKHITKMSSLLCRLPKWRAVSVVLTFNASLNDVAPDSPIPFADDPRTTFYLLHHAFYSFQIWTNNSNKAFGVWYFSWLIRSVNLHQFLEAYCLLFSCERTKQSNLWMLFVFNANDSNQVQSLMHLSLGIHSKL